METVRSVWDRDRYLLDTHTAVAWKVAEKYEQQVGDGAPIIVLGTASPFKFADSVLQALGDETAVSEQEPLNLLTRLAARTGWPVPAGLAGLKTKPVLHDQSCQVDKMPDLVEQFTAKIVVR